MLSDTTRLRLRSQLEALDVILAGVSEQALVARPASGKWSALENLAHLARHHEVFLERLRRIRDETAPALARYRAEDDPEWSGWAALGAPDVLSRLRGLRAQLIAIVESLSPAELDRTGVHSAMGPLPVALWLEFFLLHEAHHLYAVLTRSREASPR
jgi:hypothetical protein